MNRLFVAVLSVAACLLAAAAGVSRAADTPARSNIVMILADDIGYGDLSCYGAKLVQAPMLDRLAREGRRFTDAHSPASTCSPSRRALMTGAYSWRQQAGGARESYSDANRTARAAKSAKVRPAPFLVNLDDDLRETKNLAAEHLDKVRELQSLFDKLRNAGRSRPEGE
jgi:hypothetical protein